MSVRTRYGFYMGSPGLTRYGKRKGRGRYWRSHIAKMNGPHYGWSQYFHATSSVVIYTDGVRLTRQR